MTWSTPRAVNDDASSDSFNDITPAVQYDGFSTWLVVWSRNGELYFSVSKVDNLLWSIPQSLHEAGCKPVMTQGVAGEIGVVWPTNCNGLNSTSNIHYTCTHGLKIQ